MVTAAFGIRFDFLVDSSRINIMLKADVQEHHSNLHYKVGNFRISGHKHCPILPEIKIHKIHDAWVHVDSGKPSDLSSACGRAIDARN